MAGSKRKEDVPQQTAESEVQDAAEEATAADESLDELLAGVDEVGDVLDELPTEQEKEESPAEANRRLTSILNKMDPGLPNVPGIDQKPKTTVPRGPVRGHPRMDQALSAAAADLEGINAVLSQGNTLPSAAISHGQQVLIPADVRDVPNRFHCARLAISKDDQMGNELVDAMFGFQVKEFEEKDPYDGAVMVERKIGLGPDVRLLASKAGFHEKPWVYISSKLYELLKVGVAEVHHPAYLNPYNESIDDDMGNGLHRSLGTVFSRETIRDLTMVARHENVSILDALRGIFANLVEAHRKSVPGYQSKRRVK